MLGAAGVATLSSLSAQNEAGKWQAAAIANGGTVSAARLALITTLISGSMACGHWQSTDDIALLVAENAGSALTTLKRRALMTVTAAPTFTTDRGYAFNGTSQYIDTRFIPSTMATCMANGNIRQGIYERTNVGTNTTSFGVVDASAGSFNLRARNGSSQFAANMGGGAANFTGITDSSGLHTAIYTGGSTSKAWERGAALTDITGLSKVSTGLGAFSYYIAARNNSGTADLFRASTVGCAEWGAPLGGGTTAELAWYTALQAFLTAVGANV